MAKRNDVYAEAVIRFVLQHPPDADAWDMLQRVVAVVEFRPEPSPLEAKLPRIEEIRPYLELPQSTLQHAGGETCTVFEIYALVRVSRLPGPSFSAAALLSQAGTRVQAVLPQDVSLASFKARKCTVRIGEQIEKPKKDDPRWAKTAPATWQENS